MEIVNIQQTATADTFQAYDSRDTSLVSSARISRPFGLQQDYVEYFIYDSLDTIISTNYFVDSYYSNNIDPVTGLFTVLELDPETDVRSAGFNRGSVRILYNFFRKLFRSSVTDQFWIKEVSTDRTELRVCRQDLSNDELQQTFNDYNLQNSTKAYYPDFYLNFGDNRLLIAVNVAYALQEEEGCLLIKLYEPLPDDLGEKSTFWAVDKLSDEVGYQVTIDVPIEEVIEQNALRGPNYNVDILEKIGQTTPTYNYATLFQTSVSASFQQLRSIMEEKGLDINVDYSNFSNFIHFSSTVERLNNFKYKASLIEQYTNDINNLSIVTGNSSITSGSKAVLQAKIDALVEKFDGYEYYLYFESSSTAWPKSNTTKPYTLYPVTSSQARNWLGDIDIVPTATTQSILYSASIYDIENKDAVVNTIPEYLKQDPANLPYQTFLNMIGQHFDNIWVYLKDVTERYNANNNLTKGISKDLVGDAIRALGLKLYTNTSISDNIYYSLLATNPDGSTVPPTGSEMIKYYIPYAANGLYVVSEYVDPDYMDTYQAGETIPGDDITKGYYKRLYHNVPYLLKTKGTMRGLRALINCFGIPDSILRINEYGGSDKSATTPDLVQRRHSLAYYNSSSINLKLPWAGQNYYFVSASNKDVVPDTVEFRFKSVGLPNSTYTSQSIFQVNQGSATQFGVNLVYDSTTAIPSSSYQYYGNLRLFLSGSQGYAKTSPIYLPFYDPTLWWNIMIKRETGSGQVQSNSTSNRYWVYAKSTAYDEEGNAAITFQGSQSIYVNGAVSSSYNGSWNTFNTSSVDTMFRAYLGGTGSNNVLSPNNAHFQGYFQEFRYWGVPLSETAFDEHVINSTSYRSNTTTGSVFDLTYRLPLGSNLNIPYLDTTGSLTNLKDYDLYELGITGIADSASLSSYHPAVTGTIYLPFNTQIVNSVPSFISGSTAFSYGLFGGVNNKYFQPFEVTDLIPTPATGVNQKVNNKVTVVEESDLAEDVLSPFVSIQRPNQDLSRNSTDIEVGFAPSDVIDLDATNQLGYFNIDQYIGSPTDAYSSSYTDLDNLRKTYFQKYLSKYNVKDFIRLIKYYDNSLFKMIKDFVPARANLATGIIVKPHILERPKYARNEPIVTRDNNYTSSIDMVTITGSNPEDTYLNTSHTRYLTTKLGTVTQSRTDLREPFTGDFGGSEIEATDGYFPQIEISDGLIPGSTNTAYLELPINPLENNSTTEVRSARFLSLDYSSNMNIPVNLGLVTGALALYPSRSANPGSKVLSSSYWPFAYVNDYNWTTYTRNDIRYDGSRLIGAKYNTYTSASGNYAGDISYGKTPVINRNSYKIGWVKNIQELSLNFPDKTQIQLKYLIDKDQNILDLNQRNTNLFEVQNTFKSGDQVIVSISDPTLPSFQKDLDGSKTIFRGGFSYDPIIYRENREKLFFRIDIPKITSNTFGYQSQNSKIFQFKTEFGLVQRYTGEQAKFPLLTSADGSTTITIGGAPTTYAGTEARGWYWREGVDSTNGIVTRITDRPMATTKIYNSVQYASTLPTHAAKSWLSWPTPSWDGTAQNAPNNNWFYNETTPTAGTAGPFGLYTFNLTGDDATLTKFNLPGDVLTTNLTADYPLSAITTRQEGTGIKSHLFVAPYNGTFTISGSIPFAFELTYPSTFIYIVGGGGQKIQTPLAQYGFKFKPVLVLEKQSITDAAAGGTSWQYVAASRLRSKAAGNTTYTSQQTYTGYTSAFEGINPNYGTNEIAIGRFGGAGTVGPYTQGIDLQSAYMGGIFNMELRPDTGTGPLTVELNEGDALRLRFFFIDSDAILSYAIQASFSLGLSSTTFFADRPFTNISLNAADFVDLPYFNITDTNNTVSNYNTSAEFNSNALFTSPGDNTILFASSSQDLIGSASFIPSSSTQDYYSEVIDRFEIKEQDIIRIGSIKDVAPSYFTVLSVDNNYGQIQANVAFSGSADEFSQFGGVTFNSDFYFESSTGLGRRSVIAFPKEVPVQGPQYQNPLLAKFQAIFAGTKKFKVQNMDTRISGLSSTTELTIRSIVTQASNFPVRPYGYVGQTNESIGAGNQSAITMVYVIVSDNLSTATNTVAFTSDWPTTTQTYSYKGVSRFAVGDNTSGNKYLYPFLIGYSSLTSYGAFPSFLPVVTAPTYQTRVIVDNPLSTAKVPIERISQNFAILRPKPDETSVIIEHKKRPGVVSQTILIPQDASDDLKNNVGDLFQNLNVDLSNQDQNI